jgi:O-antigen/teichoic acid export membrane protein
MIVRNRPTDPSAAGSRSFARSAAQTYATQLAAAFLSLGNVLVIARALGPEGRGQVAFLTAIAWLAASLSTLGVQEANVNFASADPRLRRSLATNSLILSVLLGGATIAVVTGLIAVFPAVGGDSDSTLRWITLAFLPVIVLQIVLRLLVQADYGFGVTNLAFVLAPVLNVAFNGVCAALGVLSVSTALGVWLAGQALECAIFVWYVQRRLAGFGRPDLALARRSVGFGAKAHAGRVMLLGNYRLDQWFVGAIAGSRELGLYSVAVAWAEALWYLPTALASVQRPDLVRAGREAAARQAARVFRAATIITTALALVMFAAAPILCVTVFGEEFRGSTDQLRILVFAAFGVVALKLFGSALVAQGRPLLQTAAIGAGFVCTIVLDIVLIPPYGGIGAAIATLTTHTLAGAVVAVIFLRVVGGSPRDLVPRASDLAWFASGVRDRFRRSASAPGA